jgi:hypothetical protein
LGEKKLRARFEVIIIKCSSVLRFAVKKFYSNFPWWENACLDSESYNPTKYAFPA